MRATSNTDDKFSEYMDEMETTFNFDLITNESIEQMKRSIFNYGEFDNIDLIDTEIQMYTKRIDTAINCLSIFVDVKACIMGKEKNEYVLYCTNSRAVIFKEKINKKKKIEIKDDKELLYTFTPDQIIYKKKDKQNTLIYIPFMEIISKELSLLYKRQNKDAMSKLSLAEAKYYSGNYEQAKLLSETAIADFEKQENQSRNIQRAKEIIEFANRNIKTN